LTSNIRHFESGNSEIGKEKNRSVVVWRRRASEPIGADAA